MDEYAAGRTPNPCLRCNEKIKFAAVLDRALALGFDAVATGHYAQLRTGADGLIELHRAVDHGKDQSYVLGVLDQQQLRALAVPARRHRQAAGARGGRPGAGCWSPTSPTRTTSASSPTATTPAGCARSSATATPTPAATSSTRRRGRCWAATTGTVRPSPSASAAGCASAARRPTASRASCSTSSRSPAPSPSGRASGSRSTGSAASGRAGAAPCPTGLEGRRDRPAARPRRRAPGRGRPWTRTSGVVEVELLDPAEGIAPGQAVVIYDGTRVVGSATIDRHPRASGCPA